MRTIRPVDFDDHRVKALLGRHLAGMHANTPARRGRDSRPIVAEARSRGYAELLLETGTSEAFEPALLLYRSRGFAPCGRFGDYAQGRSTSSSVWT